MVEIAHVDPSQKTDDASSQPLLKIQSSNYRVQPDVTKYPEELKMLIVSLNHSFLSSVMATSFLVPMTWLSLECSTTVFNKTSNVVTFQLTNNKKYKLTKKQFAQVFKIPTAEPYYEVTNEQVIHMFNNIGHQPHSPKSEGILVPSDVPKEEFTLYQHLKTVEDDSEVFPTVARILDAMLQNVDPTNPVLVSYLTTINPNVEVGVLLQKLIRGTSKHEKSIHDDNPKDDDLMVSFVEIQFDPEEENIPDHMLMTVKKVKEDVNFKVEEIHTKMTKEVFKLDKNYSNLHTKVDIIDDAVKKVVEFYNSLITKVDTNLESDSKFVANLEELLGSLKESLSKLDVSPSYSISQSLFQSCFLHLKLILWLRLFRFCIW
ncbi:unnamed protein product [Lactuca saligna]|uniref:Uncharacterized protein n=1 Tax=Lactuca saligna TaxID=75948 RepID=A0AA35YW73_LACSI|nr:unnamed protein product [Lactuca saligna]